MSEFSFDQTLQFYYNIEKNIKSKLIFEQDMDSISHQKIQYFLLDKLFTPEGWIQNLPNNTDFSYPIERLWGIIKPIIERSE